ncbi:Metallo-hydrolase/oxidoreductase [Schizopora paradoxa]|uniref:Metallo-hydrolase/oxidoreductase n=1 Tax=Schizopora paradoxa TaxID=27342 RepID=A0A0H2RK21_9AGAM|nr:Metallo-hydrolase/oxidoreductase [Schizopora paradoxa]
MTTSQDCSHLPPPGINQAYCHVSALEGGMMQFPSASFVTPANPEEVKMVPSLAFLITHAQTGERLLFDLGIRKDINTLPPTAAQDAASFIGNWSLEEAIENVPNALAKGGLKPGDISRICLSHCHFDHIGDPALYSNARFIVGERTREILENGYPKDPKSEFASDLSPESRTEYLRFSGEKCVRMGPFERALDLYGDGSLYVVDTPGHLPGHVSLLARTSADGAWLLLAGDLAHDCRLLHGTAKIASVTVQGPNGESIVDCAHADQPMAERTIVAVQEFMKLEMTEVIIAHDAEWYAVNKGGEYFWPGKISPRRSEHVHQ